LFKALEIPHLYCGKYTRLRKYPLLGDVPRWGGAGIIAGLAHGAEIGTKM
jgi:hypothetical protein